MYSPSVLRDGFPGMRDACPNAHFQVLACTFSSSGIDMKCVIYVMDDRGNVLEKTLCKNTLDEATALAMNLLATYHRDKI